MKTLIKNTLILFIVLSSCLAYTQVTGTPYVFKGKSAEEPILGYIYNLDSLQNRINSNYMYTMKVIYRNSTYEGKVTWTSGNEEVVTIDSNGVVMRTGTFAFEEFRIKGVIEEGPLKAKEVFVDLDLVGEGGGFTNILKGNIIVQPTVFEYEEVPLDFILFPSGNRDYSTTFTVNDESIAKVINGRYLKALNEGEVRIIAESSVDPSVKDSLDIKIINVIDTRPPTITLENGITQTQDTVHWQRSATNKIPTATADDFEYGNLPVDIKETGATTFDGTRTGHYNINYYAKDEEDNETSLDLVIHIMDTITPVMEIDPSLSISFKDKITAMQGTGLRVPKATAIDDDNSMIEVVIDSTGYSPNTEGVFPIIYTATDFAGNTVINDLTLEITAGNPPVISVVGGHKDGDMFTINEGQEFYVPEATAMDAVGNEVAVTVDIGNLNTLVPGLYPIKYTTIDRFERTDEINLTLKVKDIYEPEITNADDFKVIQRVITGITPTIVTKVEGTDNVGITHYTINEVNSFTASSIYDVDWFTNIYEGTITITNDGTISVTKPTKEDFTHKHYHYFRITAHDADGNKAVAYMQLMHLDTATEPIIEARESEYNSWRQISYKSAGDMSVSDNLTYEIENDIRFKVDSTLFQLKANPVGSSFEKYELKGDKASDFYFENHISGNPLISTNSNESLKLKNAFPEEGKTYELQILIHTTFPTRIIPIDLKIDVKKLVELIPNLPAIEAVLENSPEVIPDPVTGEKIASLQNLMAANGLPISKNVVGNIVNDFLSQNFLEYPIIKQGAENAKFLISKLPYALYINKEGNITTIFVKGQKGPVSIQVEFIIDKNVNGAYWMMNIGSSIKGAGIQPSRDIHSSLEFLDHMEGNIVYTNTTINKSNFKCLTLVTDDNLTAGIHLVAKGPLLPPGVTFPGFPNPKATARIGLTEAGWTVPDLTLKLKFEAEFISKFDELILEYMVGESGPAQQAIKASQEAARLAHAATSQVVRIARSGYKAAVLALKPLAVVYREAEKILRIPKYTLLGQKYLRKWSREKAAKERKKEFCGPGCYDLPVPKWCSVGSGWFKIYYPCGFQTQEVCLTVCIPDPVAQAYAVILEAKALALIATIETQQAIVDPLIEDLNIAKIPYEAGKLIVEEAEIVLDLAREANNQAWKTYLASSEIAAKGLGAIGSIALSILKHVKLVETSSASIETTLSAANSGNFSGTLSFGIKLKGASKVDKSASFSFSDPVGSTVNIAKSLIE